MNDESSYGGFIQFPLCLIATISRPFRDVLNDCFSWGVVNFIDKTRGDKPPLELRTSAGQEKAMSDAREVIGFRAGNARSIIDGASRARQMEATWTGRNGATCLARVRTEFLFDARDGGGFQEMEFRILLAVYSAIGTKPYAKIPWQAFRDRAAGWTKNITNKSADDCGPIYSRWQIDRALKELAARGCFASATYNRGERYWSHSLTVDQLWERIRERKLRGQQFRAQQNLRDSERSAQLLAELGNGSPT